MSTARVTLTVLYEDGSEQQVTADQRDIVKVEREEQASIGDLFAGMQSVLWRGLAFYASKRQGLIPADEQREAWEDRAVQAVPGAADPLEQPSPGQPDQSTAKPSTSRGGPGSRSRKSSPGTPEL